jgi:plasmid stabilization system protein ParE
MGKEVVLTPLAIINYEDIVAYLILNWGAIVAGNFITRFENLSELLSENPAIFPFVNKDKEIRKCVLTKHNVLYFKEYSNSIKVLVIFDTRQDPEKSLALI